MSEYKIFSADNMFWVLTKYKENVLKILKDEDMIDEETTEDDINIKECNYNDYTWQPLSTLKNILEFSEIDHIKNMIDEEIEITFEKDGVKYFFSGDLVDLGYQAVKLQFKQILNNPKILSEFEVNSIISTTEY